MKVTAAATRTLSESREMMSTILELVALSHIIKLESGANRSITPPIITLITAYVPEDRDINTQLCWSYHNMLDILRDIFLDATLFVFLSFLPRLMGSYVIHYLLPKSRQTHPITEFNILFCVPLTACVSLRCWENWKHICSLNLFTSGFWEQHLDEYKEDGY